MSIDSRTRLLVIASLGATLSFAAPALAQIDETNAASVPACSESMTDHCINHHGGWGHHWAAPHHHHRHHHHHKGM